MAPHRFIPLSWPMTVSNGQPNSSLAYLLDALEPQSASDFLPVHFTYYPYYVMQDTRLHRPIIQCHSSLTHTQPSGPPRYQDEQRRSQDSEVIAVCIACPQCWKFPKHPDYRFCSIACSQSAARSAPQLTRLPPRHQISIEIATRFINCWGSERLPKVLAVYMINLSEASRRRYEEYRDFVEARGQFKRLGCYSGNERKQFRSTSRACNLGEEGNVYPCSNPACWLCETIRCGFGPILRRKRSVPLGGGGIRLGAGIYATPTSSKADRYAHNIHDPNSTVHTMLVCSVVVGEPFVTDRENPMLRCPPEGYDSVHGRSGSASDFTDDEYVFYDEDAIRPAFLVVYGRTDGH